MGGLMGIYEWLYDMDGGMRKGTAALWVCLLRHGKGKERGK